MTGTTTGREALPPLSRADILIFHEASGKTAAELSRHFGVGPGGLPAAEAAQRRMIYGQNKTARSGTTAIDIFFRQFRSAFIYLLFIAGGIAFYLGEHADAVIILLFLLINAGLGFFQEYRAEKSLAILGEFVERKTRILRDGKEMLLPVRDVVPGDIIVLDAGDMIPADGYFIRADGITIDESSLTGESVPAPKKSGALEAPPSGITEAENIGFARTTLLSGDGELLVFATGDRTEVGKIARAMRDAESPSAFELGVSQFSAFILKMIGVVVPLVFILHLFTSEGAVSVWEFLLFSIALTISAIPEALPLVTTISLSHGALRLAKKHVVPRRLSAIEDLGSIDILATDKTGTITENKLTVAEIRGTRDTVLRFALMAPLSAPDAHNVQNSVFDKALLAEGGEALRRGAGTQKRLDELPFDPVRKKESVLVRDGESTFLVVRGAPETVLSGGVSASDMLWAESEGEKGRRVLAVAYKELRGVIPPALSPIDEEGVTLLGLVSFVDPLKPTTKRAVAHAKSLGVSVKLITGDAKEVAGWVAYEAGIITDPKEVLLGSDFERMDTDERAAAVEHFDVFARTTPTQKFEIVKTLERNHLVGFLGEGFNDAPALKLAHVGIAVFGASDIAQDASDIVLMNHSLEVIVDGIKEGRRIFANTIKYIRATLTSNFGNFYALAFASLFIPFLPMLPIQVLLLNLLSDFPMIGVAADSVDEGELKRPRGYHMGEVTGVAMVLGIISTMFDFAFFGYFVRMDDPAVLQTMWFLGSVFTELILLFSIRTALPFWRARPPSATLLLLTFGVMGATLAIPFIGPMRELFGFTTPAPEHLLVAGVLVVLYFGATEGAKLMFYRYFTELRDIGARVFSKERHLRTSVRIPH